MIAAPVQQQTDIQNLLVVKIGGGAGLDIGRCAADLARLAQERPLIIVHGVSDAMNRLCEQRGIPVRTLVSPGGHSSRYTDAPTREVFVEAARQVSEALVAALQASGVQAAGMVDDCPVYGQRKSAVRAVVDGRIRIVRDDYSGSIHHVATAPLLALLRAGYTPVLPPLALSDKGPLNVDGDRAAAAVAAACAAAELVILSNVRGLYRRYPDESSFVPQVQGDPAQAMEWAQGRMKRKVLGAAEALSGGVGRVVIGDGRSEQPVTAALAGQGTQFTGQGVD